MNKRDFCFWLQGYMELTTNISFPNDSVWELILEHLQLATDDDTKTNTQFINVVSVLSGFVSIQGDLKPSQVQWKRMKEVVAECFTKVTPELEDGRINEIEKIIDEAIKKDRDNQPNRPYLPYPNPHPWDTQPNQPDPFKQDPWQNPPQIVCSAEPQSSVFCATVDNNIACSDLDYAYDQRAKIVGGDMYDKGADIAMMT